MKAKECYCGQRIIRVRLPDEFTNAWGQTWWKADNGSALCYADDESMSETDRRARHEPMDDWVTEDVR